MVNIDLRPLQVEKKEGKNAKRPLATPGKKVNLGLRRLQVGKIDAKTEFNQTTDWTNKFEKRIDEKTDLLKIKTK